MLQAGRIPKCGQGIGCWLVSLQDKEKDKGARGRPGEAENSLTMGISVVRNPELVKDE